MRTKVIFRKFKETKNIIAVFPELTYPNFTSKKGLCMDYMNVGQHGECDYQTVMNMTHKAEYPEYKDLFEELRYKQGYDLKVVTKELFEKGKSK